MSGWIEHVLGLDNGSGSWYLWWSGIGADFQELALLGVVIGLYRQHNCHARGCWRLKRHAVEGTPFVVCRKHHPTLDDEPSTAEEIKSAHRQTFEASR